MDILVTIPKSEYENDDRETLHMESDGSLVQFWSMGVLPKGLHVGDRIYFLKHERIESSMRVIDIQVNGDKIQCQTTQRLWRGNVVLFLDDLRTENHAVRMRGFQGFRYLQKVLHQS